MSASPAIVGLMIGIVIGAMDFSLARSFASLIRPSNVKAAMAIIVGGFAFRLGAVGLLLWMLSRAANINFVAVCVGLAGAFTVLTLLQPLRSFINTGRDHKQLSDRR